MIDLPITGIQIVLKIVNNSEHGEFPSVYPDTCKMFFQSSVGNSTIYTSGRYVLGDGGGGDGSSGSEEDGNNGGVSTVSPPTGLQTTYDVLRGLGIVGGSGTGDNEHQLFSQLPGLSQFVSNVHRQVTHFSED